MTVPASMQALNFTAINRLELQDVAPPVIERADDVIVRVRAAGVCGSDLHGYTGQTGRRHPPLVMGHEAAGEVVAVGDAVTRVKPGDRVAVYPLVYLPNPDTGRLERKLIGMNLPGAYAEYVKAPAGNLFPMPAALGYDAGSLTEPTAVAVHAVGITQIRPYDSVLVIGAGTIGLLTMQVLLLSGARQVVVSDVSDARLEVARRMGAVDVVNPSRTDFDAYVRSFTAGHGFDITFEAVGITPTVAQSVTAVKDGGKIVWIGNNQRTVEVDMQAIVTRELSVLGTYGMNERDFGRALQMLADGKIDVASLVTRRAALSEGPTLFDELLRDPETIKCVIQMA